MELRVGIGYDIHRLVEGRRLLLGGVEIPYIKGLLGHSDGDALLHAVCDAILGALSVGDIGEHFPDSDPRFSGADSASLLEKVREMMEGQGFSVNNLDTIIYAEQPKFLPFKKQIQASLGRLLRIEPVKVSVKAKTNEGLGEIGAGEAIACHAVVTLIKE
jgi:2-C-methyl-D-erythritol 2,4-cyclodiphosphate synthase